MIDLSEPVIGIYFGVVGAILGAVLGSFLNCFAWRIAHDEKITKGRSHCPHCGHVLQPWELIPVVSWIIQGGKCRSCKTKISPRYLIAELFLAGMFVWTIFTDGITIRCLRDLIFLCVLFTISLVDLEIYIIPNPSHFVSLGAFALALPFIDGGWWPNLRDGLIGAALLGGGVLLISLVMNKIMKKATLGGGDVELLFVCGMYLGPMKGLFGLVTACIIGIAFNYIGNAVGRKKNEEDPAYIPFGPAISMGMYVMLLIGEPLVNMYMSLYK